MKRFQLLTTAIFLLCTLLIAGCTGRGVEAQTTPAPEATPTATTNIQAGIQTISSTSTGNSSCQIDLFRRE